MLLRRGVNVLVKNQDGNTPLEVARLNEHAEVVAMLETAKQPKGMGGKALALAR
jgi:ankyrin repeat protein